VIATELQPVAVGGELGSDFECALDQWEFPLVPHEVEGEPGSRLCQLHERDAAGELLDKRGVDERHSAAAGQVAPDGGSR